MTRIRRMTITLPPRLRGVAEHEARRIAETAAERIVAGAPGEGGQNVTVEIDGHGRRGHALAQAVGGGLAQMGFGRR